MANSPLIPLERFLRSLQGTEVEVWGKLLRVEARVKSMTAEGWSALLEELGGRAAHPLHPAFTAQQTKAPPALPGRRKQVRAPIALPPRKVR